MLYLFFLFRRLKSKLILDVGCGNANLAKGDVNVDFFKSGVNVQIGQQLIGEAVNPKRIKNFVVADACHLPFKNECFDVAYSSHVIEHVLNPFLMLSELYRVSKRKVIVKCPHRKGSGAKRPFHINYLDEDWFKRTSSKYGFKNTLCFTNNMQAFLDFPIECLDNTLLAKAFRYAQIKVGLTRPFEVEAWITKNSNLRENDPVKLVCVYNDKAILKSCLLKSKISLKDVCFIKNSVDALPVFFNKFAEANFNVDCWLVFCHQDFVFTDNLQTVMAGKNANTVYGVTGVRFGSRKLYGQFLQTDNSIAGLKLGNVEPVQTLDEMCLIVHSSLFRKGLRFDEQFKYHFYGADLCLQAYCLGFNVFAIQVSCQHKSKTLSGKIDSEDYLTQLQFFAKKWFRFLPIKTTTKLFVKEDFY